MMWLSWIAFVIGVCGLLLAVRTSKGWFITGTSSLLWVIYAIITAQPPLIITAMVWSFIEFRNGVIMLRNEKDDKNKLLH